MRINVKRIIVTVVLICVTTTLLLSEFYIIENTNHDCTHEHCPICLQIDQCQNALRESSSALAYFGMFALSIAFFLCAFFATLKNRYAKDTLFGQKVKINI